MFWAKKGLFMDNTKIIDFETLRKPQDKHMEELQTDDLNTAIKLLILRLRESRPLQAS